jgi:hypothetical protein
MGVDYDHDTDGKEDKEIDVLSMVKLIAVDLDFLSPSTQYSSSSSEVT